MNCYSSIVVDALLCLNIKEASVVERERERNTKKGTWRSRYLLVLGVKEKDTLIEHSSKDQLYEINGPKKKFPPSFAWLLP